MISSSPEDLSVGLLLLSTSFLVNRLPDMMSAWANCEMKGISCLHQDET